MKELFINHWPVFVSLGIIALSVGVIVTYLIMHQKLSRLREQHAVLQATLQGEQKSTQEKLAALQQAREQLLQSFSTLSSQALKANNEAFLQLANENLKQFQVQAQNDLSQKEKAIEHLVKPIKETLDKTEKQLRQMEHERKEAYGALSHHLQSMLESQQALQGETRNLVNALRRPEVRGQWGEMTLRRLAELAGMVEHCDFYEQEHTKTDTGHMRPDMIVRMPGRREIVVDVKTPLDAYLNATEAADDASRQQHLLRHCKNVKDRVRELSAKAYWNQFERSPDFVVLFIPGEQFLAAALDLEPDLLEYAMQQKVMLTTPTSLMAILRAIAYGWRQEKLNENAEVIRQLGGELYARIAGLTEHISRLGKSLTASVQHFNKTVGSLDTRVLPSVRKFTEMGIEPQKDLENVAQIESTARSVETFTKEEKHLEEQES